MHHVVLDTNVLVGAAYAEGSHSRRIVEACLHGELAAVASSAVKREYELILTRAVRQPDYEMRLGRLLQSVESVEPDHVPRVVEEDAQDDKFLAAAVAAGAGWIVTSDRHLLALDPYGPVRILSPTAFVHQVLEGR